MTSKQFFNLPINKSTIKELRKKNIFFSNPAFYSEFISSINAYLYLPKSIKKITSKVTMETIYNELKTAKDNGYRKELKLEF